jgi:NAD(P)-dependent dehydrogenase (short-subunit alcohol dehydrogenase family)
MPGVLEGKVAIVTGAAKGVGAGIARAYGAEGAKVAVLDVRERQSREVAAAIVDAGGEAAAYTCDITDTAQVEATVADVVRRWGTVDILVNNAMTSSFSVPFEEITDEQVDEAYRAGPRATIAFMRTCFPYLRDGGRVINLRSGSEVQGLAGFGAYITAKAAIGGLTRAAAKEWGRHGITVNAIAPYVFSDSAAVFLSSQPEEEARLKAQLAIPRFGDADVDVGRVAVFLAGPDSAYVTGCTINANGGVTLFA